MITDFCRRAFTWMLGITVAVAVSGAVLSAASSSGQRKPNIIFIMADDLGYADIGAFGQKRIRTPNIDRMAAEGTRFTSYYAGAAVCAPTRSCVMTGLHTGHGRVRANHGFAGLDRVPLEVTDVTMAEVLRRGGYSTAGLGKWGLGEDNTLGVPNKQGFDFWYGYLNQDVAEDYYPEKIFRNEKLIELPGNAKGAKGSYSNDLFTEEGLRFIGAHRRVPFFLYLAYTIPHAILAAPEDSMRDYEGAFPDDPPLVNGKVRVERPRQTYAAMITRLDRYVGQVFAKLRELGLDEDTIVFFTSDNGATSKGGMGDFFGSAGPLKGWKGNLTEGGLRAPMIVRWPGRVPAGRTSDEPWAGWDVLPTAAELAGVAAPAGLDGLSVVGALRGGAMPKREYFYWEMPAKNNFAQAVRIGDYKVVRTKADAPLEVYDLRTDIGEKRDLASEKPEVVARARELFRTARTPAKHWPVPSD